MRSFGNRRPRLRGRMLRANRLAQSGTAVGVWPSSTPSTSSRFEAGSVLTISTRLPASASISPVAQESEVLPTPPAGEEEVVVRASGSAMSAAAGFRTAGAGFSPAACLPCPGDAQLLRQLHARGVHAGGHDLAIHRENRQGAHTGLHPSPRPGWAGLRRLTEVVAGHADAVAFEPLQVGGKLPSTGPPRHRRHRWNSTWPGRTRRVFQR